MVYFTEANWGKYKLIRDGKEIVEQRGILNKLDEFDGELRKMKFDDFIDWYGIKGYVYVE